jgi:hypothetical protein
MEERRKLERFSLEVPTKIEVVVSAGKKESLHIPTSDICASGAFFRTKKALPEGTKVKIDLILVLDRLKHLIDNSRANVKVNGTVVRSGSAGMAICFDEDYQIMPLEDMLHWNNTHCPAP